ncbi:unnamed protein product [Phytomonas sp. Hart1]|nr:unnamed protein product [Phytomonas sp. Hart1]|eukprot:CCW66185.1 unnamed protein product [Phytomonas sp. isolate Hart1]
MEYRIVNIRPLSLLIRLAPVGIFTAVHCSGGQWPTNDECLLRASKYGFSLDNFSKKPNCLWTHIFIHFSNEHFLANTLALTYALLEFKNCYLIDSFQGESLRASFQSAIGSSLILLLAGPIGGIGGQMLYNMIQVERPFEKAMAMLKTQLASLPRICHLNLRCFSSAASPSGSLSESYNVVSRTITSTLKSATTFGQSLFLHGAAGIQKMVNRSMLMCGSSAAVCGLAGFNAVYFHNPLSMIFMVIPDAMLLLQDAINHVCASDWDKYMDVLRSLMPRQTVGHAAHVGGFMVGASLGWLLRRLFGPRPASVIAPMKPGMRRAYLFTL